MEDYRGLDHLEIWQVAINFAVYVQRSIIPQFPVEEKWGLSAQLRRSVQSIPANIAEGYGRYYFTENVRFCYIARGSLEETYSHLVMANRLDYLSSSDFQSCNTETIRLRQMLHGYIAFLKRSKRGENEPGAIHHVREGQASYGLGDPDERDQWDYLALKSSTTNHESTNHESTNIDYGSEIEGTQE